MTQAAAVEQSDVLMENLMSKLIEQRKALGLSQAELAERVGVNRMTVVRAEGEGADPQLSNFIAMALALGLVPSLPAPSEMWNAPLPRDLVHRGYAHVRTKHDLQYSDRRREAALAKSWEAANVDLTYGVSPTLPALVPNCTQDQASACATVIQWLGSEGGFDFLTRALGAAGYAITEAPPAKESVLGRVLGRTKKAPQPKLKGL